MKNLINISALVMFLTFTGCQKDVQSLKEDMVAVNSNARTSAASNGTIYLSVTVENAMNGNSTMIHNDEQGNYVHGSKQVDAQLLSSDGNFYMNTNNSTTKGRLRFLKFPTNATGYEKEMNGLSNYSLRTTVADGAPWIQTMGVGSWQLVGFRIWGVKTKGVTDWRLVYKNGYESDYWNTASVTDYAKVTRVSLTQWTIEPTSHATAALYTGNATSTSDRLGYHVVPFKLTLTKKP